MTSVKEMSLVELAKKLLTFRTAATRPEEMRTCLDFCASFFEGLPMHIRQFEDAGTLSMVIQNCEGTDLDVLLLGHIDVTDGPTESFTPREEGGRLYGRGSCDMKAFVASSMVVLRDLIKEESSRLRLGLAIVTDEESGGAHGACYLAKTIGYRAKVILVPDDGDDISTVVTRSKHGFAFRFEARGRSAHGNRPWDGVNAIELLFATLERLRRTFPSYDVRPESTWVNTHNLGMLEGGTAPNEVPGTAQMSVDIRIVPPTTREDVLKAVSESLVPGVTSTLLVEAEPTFIGEEDPLLKAYCATIEQVTGQKVKYKWSGGGTDARHFAAKGMTVIVHQGTCADAQGEQENVDIASLDQLMRIQKEFIAEYFREISRAA